MRSARSRDIFISNYNLFFKTIAIIVLCLFTINTISWAAPDAFQSRAITTETMVPKLAIGDNEYTISMGTAIAIKSFEDMLKWGFQNWTLPMCASALPKAPNGAPLFELRGDEIWFAAKQADGETGHVRYYPKTAGAISEGTKPQEIGDFRRQFVPAAGAAKAEPKVEVMEVAGAVAAKAPHHSLRSDAGQAGAMSRRDFLKNALLGGVAVAVAPSLLAALKPETETEKVVLTEALKANLVHILAQWKGIEEDKAERLIHDSIAISNSDSYRKLVGDTYKKLIRRQIWKKEDGLYPVVFLKGLDINGFAVALKELNIVVVGMGEMQNQKNKDRKSLIEWLAHKIAHEGTHIVNFKKDPDMPLIEDEAIAFEMTWKSVAAWEGKDSEQAKAQKKVSDAFKFLVNNQKRACEALGIGDFRDIYYRNIELSPDLKLVGIELFNMADRDYQPRTLWIDVPGDKILKYEYEFNKHGLIKKLSMTGAGQIPVMDYGVHKYPSLESALVCLGAELKGRNKPVAIIADVAPQASAALAAGAVEAAGAIDDKKTSGTGEIKALLKRIQNMNLPKPNTAYFHFFNPGYFLGGREANFFASRPSIEKKSDVWKELLAEIGKITGKKISIEDVYWWMEFFEENTAIPRPESGLFSALSRRIYESDNSTPALIALTQYKRLFEIFVKGLTAATDLGNPLKLDERLRRLELLREAINIGIIGQGQVDLSSVSVKRRPKRIVISTDALAGFGDIKKLLVIGRNLLTGFRELGEEAEIVILLNEKDWPKIRKIQPDHEKENLDQRSHAEIDGVSFIRYSREEGHPHSESRRYLRDGDIFISLVRPVSEILGTDVSGEGVPKLCVLLNEYNNQDSQDRGRRSARLSGMPTGFTGFGEESLGFFVNEEDVRWREEYYSQNPAERQEAKKEILRRALSREGESPSEELIERLAAKRWAFLYQHKLGHRYLHIMDEVLMDDEKSDILVFAPLGTDGAADGDGKDEFAMLRERCGDMPFAFECAFSGGRLNTDGLLGVAEHNGVGVVSLGTMPDGLFRRFMLYSDLPVAVTGDESLCQAMTFGKPFLYETMLWKRDLFKKMLEELDRMSGERSGIMRMGIKGIEDALRYYGEWSVYEDKHYASSGTQLLRSAAERRAFRRMFMEEPVFRQAFYYMGARFTQNSALKNLPDVLSREWQLATFVDGLLFELLKRESRLESQTAVIQSLLKYCTTRYELNQVVSIFTSLLCPREDRIPDEGSDAAAAGAVRLPTASPRGETARPAVEAAGAVEHEEGSDLAESVRKVLSQGHPEPGSYGTYERLLKAGVSIFSGYEKYLNADGRAVKARFEEMLERFQEGTISWLPEFIEFKDLVEVIPTIANPHTELFIDVFEDATDEQIKTFCNIGLGTSTGFLPHRELTLRLTRGCSNQCLTCGVNAQKGRLVHMPFPIAVKVMKKLFTGSQEITLYFDSEPLDYHDDIIGATIVDVVDVANSIGYKEASICTHGSYYRGKEAPGLVREIGKRTAVGVSFHINHPDVFSYVLRKQRGEAVSGSRREEIIQKYVDIFLPLIRETIRSQHGYSIRQYKLQPDVEAVLNPDKYEETMRANGREPMQLSDSQRASMRLAYKVLLEMHELQNEVWRRIEDQARIPEEPKEGLKQMEARHREWGILWYGRAASFLQRLGVPDEIIKTIQEISEQKKGIIGNAYMPYIDIDGSAKVTLPEDALRKTRTVGEMFSDHRSGEFHFFVKFLRAVANARGNTLSEFVGVPVEDTSFKMTALGDLKKFLKQKGVNGDSLTVDDFTVRARHTHYLKCLLDSHLPEDAVAALTAGPDAINRDLSDSELRKLHDALKDIPFLTSQIFQITFDKRVPCEGLKPLTEHGFWLKEYEFSYIFVQKENAQVLERRIFEPYRSYSLNKLRAFRVETFPSAVAAETKVDAVQVEPEEEAAGAIDSRSETVSAVEFVTSLIPQLKSSQRQNEKIVIACEDFRQIPELRDAITTPELQGLFQHIFNDNRFQREVREVLRDLGYKEENVSFEFGSGKDFTDRLKNIAAKGNVKMVTIATKDIVESLSGLPEDRAFFAQVDLKELIERAQKGLDINEKLYLRVLQMMTVGVRFLSNPNAFKGTTKIRGLTIIKVDGKRNMILLIPDAEAVDLDMLEKTYEGQRLAMIRA